MNTFQIVMLAIAGLLVASIFWEQIKLAFKSTKNIVPTIPKKPDAPNSLVEVVAAWEHLKNGCEKHNLKKAVSALKNIFPLLVIEEGDELE